MSHRQDKIRFAWGYFRTHTRDYGRGCPRLPDGSLGYYRWRKLGPDYDPHLLGLAYNPRTGKILEARTRAEARVLVRDLFGKGPDGRQRAAYRGRIVQIRVTTQVEEAAS